jgi:putative oxidoreductase
MKNKDFGLLLLRVGYGLSFAILHGYDKITGGTKTWEWLGSQMSVIGIDFLPVFWGFMAAFAEFVCALFLVIGFLTRPAALLLAFTMLIAILYHISNGEGFAHALEAFTVFVAFIVMGAGKYSLDARTKSKIK